MPPEPSHNGTYQPSGVRCRNCGRLAGPRFCGGCGQALDDRRAPLVGLVREVLEEWLSLDGRLVRTLLELPRPGRLTRLYLEGRRAPYLNPLRLYVLASVILFSSLLTLRPPRVADLNFYINDVLVGEKHIDGNRTLRLEAPNFGLPGLKTLGIADLEERLRRLAPQEAVDRLFAGMRQALSVGLFLFVPILGLALKGLYVRSRILYVDHLVFAVHFQSALFMVLGGAWLVVRIGGVTFLAGVLIYICVTLLMVTVYLGVALRRVYEDSPTKTTVSTLILFFAYTALLKQTIGIPILVVLARL